MSEVPEESDDLDWRGIMETLSGGAAVDIPFDTDKEVSASSRAALIARSASSGQRIYAVHFPFPGVGKIAQDKGGGYTWVPETLH